MGRTTLSISDDTKDRFDGLKSDESQDAFLNTLLDAYEQDDTGTPADAATSEDLQQLANRIDDLETELPRKTAGKLSRLR